MKNNFITWFRLENIQKDLKNQEELVNSAKSILSNLGDLSKLPKKYKWLLDKISKQLEHRGCLRNRSIQTICEEILNENNSSALLHYSKSPRKQGIEDLQREYVKTNFNIEILAGKNHKLTANGPNSIRLSKKGELLFGVKMNRNLHRKSFDGKIINGNWLVFQKVTTDDGGSTDSVYDEVRETIESALNFFLNTPNTNIKFLFLLDGEYWGRKTHKNDDFSRFDTLKNLSNKNLKVVSSDTISEIY